VGCFYNFWGHKSLQNREEILVGNNRFPLWKKKINLILNLQNTIFHHETQRNISIPSFFLECVKLFMQLSAIHNHGENEMLYLGLLCVISKKWGTPGVREGILSF
jgi:hypothetical protein